MRLDRSTHAARPWRIHEITRGFRLEDVWRLPVVGGPDEFPRLVQLMAAFDPERSSSPGVRGLFAVRRKAGELFGWDRPHEGVGSRVASLRDRLPLDLRVAPTGPYFDALPFNPLYQLDDEWAVEAANATVHGVLHLGWVPDEAGGYRGEMAVYVKPNGLHGAAYMAAIKPFRYVLVYPAMLREIGQQWESTSSAPALGVHTGDGTSGNL